MRNWNPVHYYYSECKENSFEPTYEELKLDLVNRVTGAEVGFEPTYEELKQAGLGVFRQFPRLVLSLPMRNWNFLASPGSIPSLSSFEPTYEELKQ